MENTYDVTIRAVVTKTIRVEAQDEAEAKEIAHGLFSTECDGDETYKEEAIECDKVEGEG